MKKKPKPVKKKPLPIEYLDPPKKISKKRIKEILNLTKRQFEKLLKDTEPKKPKPKIKIVVETKTTKKGGIKKKVLFFEGAEQKTRKEVKSKYHLINEDFKYFDKQANKGFEKFDATFKKLKDHRHYFHLVDYNKLVTSFRGKKFIYNEDEFLTRKEVQAEILEYAEQCENIIDFFKFQIFCEVKGKEVIINLDDEIFEWCVEQAENYGEQTMQYSLVDKNDNWILLSS